MYVWRRLYLRLPVANKKRHKPKNFSTIKPIPCRDLLSAFLPSFFKCPSLQGFTGVFGAVKKSRKQEQKALKNKAKKSRKTALKTKAKNRKPKIRKKKSGNGKKTQK